MKKIYLTIFLVFFLILLTQTSAWACWGFRPMGMGGSFVAVADDANAAYWNRAGLAQLDTWKDGQNQIVVTDQVYNPNGFFNRTPRLGNQYYDSFNYAMKINELCGWGMAGEWSGGGAIGFSPGIGFRLPWNMSLGIGYFYFRPEMYGTDNNNNQVRVDFVQHEIILDYLWRIVPEFSIGIHCENFWQLGGEITSPDIPGYKATIASSLWDQVNFRPSIAWMPQDFLKGLIVNTGIYDAFAKSGGPFYSFGFEYTPQAGTKIVKVKVKSGKKVMYREKTVKDENFLTNSSFRMGTYNYKQTQGVTTSGMFTLGYSYKINDAWDIGYWGYLSLMDGKSQVHNLGFACKF